MMIYGQRLFGRCEDVPGLFYVATQFAHVNYVPLFPTQSWIVFEGSENNDINRTSWRGHQIPMNLKSVLLGWGRAAMIVGAIIATIVGFSSLDHHQEEAYGMWAVAVAAIAAYFFSKRLARASAASARKLLQSSGLPQSAIDELVAVVEHRLEPAADLPDGAA